MENSKGREGVIMITVEGGTHLGIVGCYGEKTFDVDSLEDLEQEIRKDRDLSHAGKSTYEQHGETIHILTGRGGLTLFEYRVV